MTLLTETIKRITQCGGSIAEIEWVGSSDGKYVIDWATFEAMAGFTYDSGWGSQKVASDLIIVAKDWWMSRYEYDGSEGWEFHKKPTRKQDAAAFTSVNVADAGCMGWRSIEDIEDELREQRENPTGWNAIFHTHPVGSTPNRAERRANT